MDEKRVKWQWYESLEFLGSEDSRSTNVNQRLLLLEEILHHPTCMKPCKMGYLPYQLVQDFFHQQYHHDEFAVW